MKQLLMIPDRNNLSACKELAREYNLGYEFNDFYNPVILDDEQKAHQVIKEYKDDNLPAYMTLHGAFYDVLPTSIDEKIRKVGQLRIKQSIEYAKLIGAKAVVFHTNFNPFLDGEVYTSAWIKNNQTFWEGILKEYPDVNIYLENMFDASPDVLLALSESLGQYANYGVCLDYAHALLSKTSTTEWAKKLGRYVKHVHLNDNDLKKDLHLGWGAGEIERETFYELFETYMPDATILIETSKIDAVKSSLQTLEEDDFLAKYQR